MAGLPDLVLPGVVESYAAEVPGGPRLIPDEAIEIDERTYLQRPSLWIRTGADTTGANPWETLTTLLIDLRARGHNELIDLEAKLDWLAGAHFVEDAARRILVPRFGEPTVNRNREPAGWVASFVFPVTYTKAAADG